MLSDNLKCLETKKPPPNWFIAQEVINRQIGSNPLFQRRFYSSLHAVNRLEFKYKLCDLEDTVSALSFNQKGNLLARASEKTVSIWDWAAKKKRCCFPNGHDILIEVCIAKWLPLDVENFMVTSGYDGCIRLLDLEYNSSRQMINYDLLFHPTHIDRKNNWALAVHPEIPYIVFSAYNDSILSIDIRENTPNNEFCVGGHFPCIRVYDQRNISNPLYQLWTTKYNRVGSQYCVGHPHIPILATASKSNVLIWMPSGNEDPTESTFKTYIRQQYPGIDNFVESDSTDDDYNYSTDDDYNSSTVDVDD
ncbi:PREDICTED: DDB1- and CUL4-associated factor 8-like protein 1 [Cyphomyrmex costatus]|uniref:DDB1- and CUL4-associated factor 8-like protein 1 n=1 Tax=Cyphomyrmex costatus TaxID=456900 RepID=UPI00085233FB|nr:PREDICTED: DDB1- and CUL4-associated factor 8-like protein 1 [Cyphomyrmex costatus]